MRRNARRLPKLCTLTVSSPSSGASIHTSTTYHSIIPGICVVKDPRVNEADNNRFLDMMERYFGLSDGLRDARPEVAYQVGVTKEFTEKARDNSVVLTKLSDNNKAVSPLEPVFDAKVNICSLYQKLYFFVTSFFCVIFSGGSFGV